MSYDDYYVTDGHTGNQKDMIISSIMTDYIVAGAGSTDWGIQRALQITKYAFAPFAETAGRMEANIMLVVTPI